MAPEVWGMRPGRYSDQYALAVTCFFLLTGNYPLRRSGVSNARSWQHLHNFVMPSSLSEFRTDLPPAVNDVLQKALAKNPHERYATLRAFASDLFDASQDTTFIPPKTHRPDPVEDAHVQPVPMNVQTERGHWQGMQRVELALINTPAAGPITLPTAPVPALNLGSKPMTRIRPDVNTEILLPARCTNSWVWRSFLLNLLICLVLAAEYSRWSGSVNAGVALLLALCPILLVGPLLALPFGRLSLTSFSRSLLWGMFFGVTNALLCALVCLAWNILLSVETFLGNPGVVVSDFHREVLALNPQVLVLMVLALWMSVIGGVIIGIFSVRDEDVTPLIHQESLP
jgi:hypothetical protein